MGRLFSLIVIVGLAYGGLYLYYGMAMKQVIEQQIDDRGLTALEVQSIHYGPLAPVSSDARITATVNYRGAEATLDIRIIGHPIFSEELRVELDGLQALRLRIGGGQ
ncbi:hypothetical protein [Halomonas sp. BC04]|uniref:hypothetical protein n=1 Tax=Halomonas sp. BC04 TaxID=1403540 RepID=UPI0003ED88E9|nr:hypothetical protein [Halomonas sp. BC04]EWG98001.1 hypothetical protein Q427_32935 [Halomonas sp. BC04]